jgi:hypothetical protein
VPNQALVRRRLRPAVGQERKSSDVHVVLGHRRTRARGGRLAGRERNTIAVLRIDSKLESPRYYLGVGELMIRWMVISGFGARTRGDEIGSQGGGTRTRNADTRA